MTSSVLPPDTTDGAPPLPVWRYVGRLAPLAVLWGVLVGLLGWLLYTRANWGEDSDRADVREWIENTRVFRKTLTELVREYADLLRAEARANTPAKRQTSVIILWMRGGPAHQDTWDPKPDAPAEFRGEFNEIDTNVNGIRISEHLPLQARLMDKMSIVRSVTHTNPGHGMGSHWMLTGYVPTIEINDNLNPAAGSVVARMRGSHQPRMPAYVCVPTAGGHFLVQRALLVDRVIALDPRGIDHAGDFLQRGQQRRDHRVEDRVQEDGDADDQHQPFVFVPDLHRFALSASASQKRRSESSSASPNSSRRYAARVIPGRFPARRSSIN